MTAADTGNVKMFVPLGTCFRFADLCKMSICH